MRSRTALVVSGARVTRTAGRAGGASTSRRSSTACTSAGRRVGAGSSRSASPSTPWTLRPPATGSSSGRPQPRPTRISGAPAASRTFSVFVTTCSTGTLPATQEIARRSSAGCRSAKRIAKASSTPVSTSRIISTRREWHSYRGRWAANDRATLGRDEHQRGGRQPETCDLDWPQPLPIHQEGKQHGAPRVERGNRGDNRQQAALGGEQVERVRGDVEHTGGHRQAKHGSVEPQRDPLPGDQEESERDRAEPYAEHRPHAGVVTGPGEQCEEHS